MSNRSVLFSRPLLLGCAAACLLGPLAHASDKHGAEAKAAAPAAKAAPPDSAMDQLRQKLAERLGAQRTADANTPNVMRVANRGEAPVAAAVAGHAAPGAVAAHSRVAAARAAAPRPEAHGHEGHWDYEGENGPESWGKMKAEFNKCSTGQRQSPIDIRGGIAVQLEPIQFDYRATGFSVIDNGHTVQVNLPSGNAITVLGRRYELLQFHFHRPSEERINGRQFDMVAHLVHKDAENRLAVVAVLLDRGSAQPLVQAVWNSLPLEKGEAQASPVPIDLNHLLPEDRRYYTYMGSLTTPPCSEGVLWMVMKQPVQLSADQINIFARLYPMNARPVQNASGRLIKESN
ncbi:MAG: carbonic anhydrase family protein [Vitreoscilla sp.]|nr:carbonic anhydrase family protein [Vitreoscilla sp.]